MLRIAVVTMSLISIGIAGCATAPPLEKSSESENQTERGSGGGGGGGY